MVLKLEYRYTNTNTRIRRYQSDLDGSVQIYLGFDMRYSTWEGREKKNVIYLIRRDMSLEE